MTTPTLEEHADEIARLYIDEQKSLASIASRFGVDFRTVRRHLQRHGIARRGTEEQNLIDQSRITGKPTGLSFGPARISGGVA